MNKVPKMISTKDLSYISDMLNWNITIGKKANQFNMMANDKDVINIMKEANVLLKEHYNMLLGILR